jgi:hypothetical protein
MSGASWYDENFRYRYPVSINATAGASGAGNYELSITIPEKWQAFWSVIQSTGHDIYVVDCQGNLAEYKRDVFNYANKSLRLRVRNVAATDLDNIHLIYIYWGYASAPDAVTTFTPAGTPYEGQIFLGTPTNMVASDTRSTKGSEAASSAFTKPVDQGCYIWFSYSSLMSKRISTYNKFLFYEGVQYCLPRVEHPTGGVQATMIDVNKTRLLPGWVGIFVQAGTNDQDYAAIVDVTTTENQIFSLRAILSIRNQLPVAR